MRQSTSFSLRAVVWTLLVGGAAVAKQAQKAHEHGAGHLDIAVDGSETHIALETPGDDIFGFEHQPRNAEEQAQVAAALVQLRSHGDELFHWAAATGCKSTHAEVHAAQEHKTAAADEHADVDAEYTFHCQQSPSGTQLSLGLFRAFPRLKTLRVQVLSGSKQSGQVIHADQDQVQL